MRIDEKFIKLVKLLDIEGKTRLAFQKCFYNFKEKEPVKFSEIFGEFNPLELEVFFDYMTLELKNSPKLDSVHIITSLVIFYKQEDIGAYKPSFSLSGEIVNESLILD